MYRARWWPAALSALLLGDLASAAAPETVFVCPPRPRTRQQRDDINARQVQLGARLTRLSTDRENFVISEGDGLMELRHIEEEEAALRAELSAISSPPSFSIRAYFVSRDRRGVFFRGAVVPTDQALERAGTLLNGSAYLEGDVPTMGDTVVSVDRAFFVGYIDATNAFGAKMTVNHYSLIPPRLDAKRVRRQKAIEQQLGKLARRSASLRALADQLSSFDNEIAVMRKQLELVEACEAETDIGKERFGQEP